MTDRKLALSILPETLVICRLDPAAPLPDWARQGRFFSITRTPDELSVVCPRAHLPDDWPSGQSWRCLKVAGPLDLTLTGVLAALAGPLGRAGVPLFALSTYETDYLLVMEQDLERAVLVLAREGHQVRDDRTPAARSCPVQPGRLGPDGSAGG